FRSVGWENVREGVVASAVLYRLAVRLGVARGEERGPALPGVALRDAPRVECANPLGEGVGVVGARGEAAAGGVVPVDALVCPAERQDRRAILARHRERAAARILRADPVYE